jgi:hypothetical protein
MLGSEHLFQNGEGALIVGLGPGQVTLGLEEIANGGMRCPPEESVLKCRLKFLGAAGKAATLGGCKSLYRQLLDSDG